MVIAPPWCERRRIVADGVCKRTAQPPLARLPSAWRVASGGHDGWMDATAEIRAGASLGPGSFPPGVASLVRSLSLAVVLQWAGAGAILPLLPLYVKVHGGTDAIVGAVMAAYFAAAFVFQYASGRLSDRLGRLPVLVGGLVVYAAGSLLFLLPGPAALDIVFRALQGAGAGGAMVAALAMLSHAVPLSYRGRATGRIYGAELGGLAVGPVLGSVAGVGAMHWFFVAAGVASVVAIGPVLAASRAAKTMDEAAKDAREPAPVIGLAPAVAGERAANAAPTSSAGRRAGGTRLPRSIAERAVFGALLASATIGVATGVYESCWTLLMTRHGAATWEVGVSWTLFALPFVLMSRPAGWLADHFDRRWLGVAALCWTICFCAAYPFVPGVLPLMVLGIWESAGFSLALPATQSLLGEGTAPERHGHAQGLFAASQTGMTALAAAASGGLFGVAPWVPFDMAAACCSLIVALVVVSWRRVPGRVRTDVPAGVTPADA
jgi:MFS transporter, DHA1 family, multidrug resistance protein